MRIILMMLAAALAGCGTTGDYYAAVESANKYQYEIVKARAQAEAIRYDMLKQIADGGDATSKVAAAMGLAFAGMQAAPPQQGGAIVPEKPQDKVLQWAQVLTGPVTQFGLGLLNVKQQMHTSDNARDVSINTNGMMLGFGQAIQAGSTHGYQYVNPTPVIAPDPVIVTPQAPIIVRPDVVQIPTQVIEPVIVQQAAP